MNEDKRIAKNYLTRWQDLLQKRDSNKLNEVEKIEAEILFSSIESINQSDLAFLQMKYFKELGSTSYRTIKQVADELGITQKACNSRLQELHERIGKYIKHAREPLKDRRKQAVDTFYSRKTSSSNPFFIARYYLRKWYRLQEKINEGTLNEVELIESKILFLSLRELESDKISILKKKYFHPLVNGHRPKMEDISKQVGIDLKEFIEQVNQAELSLSRYITEVHTEYEKERNHAINMIYIK